MSDIFKIYCIIGKETKELSEKDYPTLRTMKAEELRKILQITYDWAFVLPAIKEDAVKDIEQRIVNNYASEKYIPIQDIILPTTNEIILTNVKKDKNPDLISSKCDWFKDRELMVQCVLNPKPKNPDTNKDKFSPIMLSNTSTTNIESKFYNTYKNVCICCQDSVVVFNVKCRGSLGFRYQASINTGEVINTVFVGTTSYKSTLKTTLTLWSSEKEIKIVPTSSLSNYDPFLNNRYMNLTFRASDIISWSPNKEGNPLYHADNYKKNIQKKYHINFARTMANDIGQVYVPGEEITPGTAIEGDKEYIPKHSGFYPKEVAPWEPGLGLITITMFVFNTIEDANKFQKRYNNIIKDYHMWGE